jgi:hypothetical protein
MAKILKLRRGTAAQHNSFTGLEGEITVDTTNDTIRVHDNVTVGGHILALREYVDHALSGNIDLGNIFINENIIGTIGTNEDLYLEPNGSGDVVAYGNILPGSNVTYSLGAPGAEWESLYVSGDTIFIGGVPLSLEPGTNELRVNNIPVSQSITYADIPNAPVDVADLTDSTNLLGGGGNTNPNLAFTGYLDYNTDSEDEATFTVVRSSKPLNAIKEIRMNPEILDTDLDPTSVRAQLEKIVNTPRESKLTLTLASDTTKVWNYAVTHIGRTSDTTEYRDYTARFIRTYSDNASGIIRMVIAKGTLSQKYWDPIAANDDWYVGTENSSSILAFTIADSTSWIRRDYEQLVKFFESVVDNVIYNGATEITDAEQLRTRFYANIDTLISDMGGNLYYNFRAYNNTRTFASVPLTSQTSTVNAAITFEVTTAGSYQADGIPTIGAGFRVGQQIILLGSSLDAYSEDPADQLDSVHNATVIVTAVNGSGGITEYTVTGYGIGGWGYDNISDGEDDQFDNSNKFSTNVSWINDHSDGSSINQNNFLQYNSGFVTTGDNANDFFGNGSKYVIAFHKGITMLAATGVSNSVQWFAITGNSGFDDDGTVDEGEIKIGNRYSLYVRCVSGPEYLPQVDQRYLVSMETTDRYGLIEVVNRLDEQDSPSNHIILQSLHEGDFTVKSNDELILTANMEVTIRGGNGSIGPSGSGRIDGRDVRIYGGDGFSNGGDTTKFGNAGDVIIRGGTAGVYTYTISAMTNASPAVVTVNRPLELTSGMLARFGSMSGLSLSDTVVYYVEQTSETQLTIYTDSDLTIPLDTRGLGSFVSGGIALGKRDGDIDLSSLGSFDGNLKLNEFVWPTNYTAAAAGQYLRVKSTDGSTPYLEFGNVSSLVNGANTASLGSDGSLTIPGNIQSEGNINIDINLDDSTLRRWQFGEDGSTVFPTNISIDYSGGNVQFPRIIADSGKAFSVQGQGTSGSAALAWTVNPDAAGQYASVAVSRGGGDNLAKVVLQAQSDSGDVGTVKLWKFDETGVTAFPNSVILAPVGQSITMQSDQYSQLMWENANVTVAPNMAINSNFYVAQNSATLDIGYRDGNSTQLIKSWLWSVDGTLTLPAGGVIAEGGGISGAIRLTPAGGANSNQALLIYPTGNAEGDHVHLTTGGGSTELYLGNDFHYVKLVDGGNIELRAATANLSAQSAWTFDTTGNIDTIQALGVKVPNGIPTNVAVINSTTGSWEANPRSNLATTGGSGSGLTVSVTETGGYASTIAIATAGTGYNNGDLITVTSGTSNATFTIVIAGRNTWTFGIDGDLTLPASGDIVNSTGVGQLANRVEGSWTVTTGTNTYSFTVPMDGTYVMWVKGNIPNGIITWNATLSVTNSNVPAIGTQYAWNYTGGGTPISLTAIPDQIRGVAGTISTDATYAGTTSNRFDFGISNTSGSSKTVYYGYTRI